MHLKDICLKLILISCDPPSQFGIPHETPRIPNCGIPKIDVFGTPRFGIPSFGIPSFGIPGVNPFLAPFFDRQLKYPHEITEIVICSRLKTSQIHLVISFVGCSSNLSCTAPTSTIRHVRFNLAMQLPHCTTKLQTL